MGIFVIFIWIADDEFIVKVLAKVGVVEEDVPGSFVANDRETPDAFNAFGQEFRIKKSNLDQNTSLVPVYVLGVELSSLQGDDADHDDVDSFVGRWDSREHPGHCVSVVERDIELVDYPIYSNSTGYEP